jgi:hypothetical protein
MMTIISSSPLSTESAATAPNLVSDVKPNSVTETTRSPPLSRAEIGAMIKAQICQVLPLNHSASNNSASPAIASPLVRAALVYTPLSLEQQAKLFQPTVSNLQDSADNLLLATLSSQYQVLAESDGKRFTFISGLPLRAGDMILMQKLSAQLWQCLTPDADTLDAVAFLPTFIAKTQASSNGLNLAWQLYRVSLQMASGNLSTSPPMQSLQSALKAFFQPMLSVKQLQQHVQASTSPLESVTQKTESAAQLVKLLQTNINNSGLTFENKLAKFSQLPNAAQTHLLQLWQQGSITHAEMNFTQDQKTVLAKLFNALVMSKQIAAEDSADTLIDLKKPLHALTAPPSAPNLARSNPDQHLLWQNFFFPNSTGTAAETQTDNFTHLVEQLMVQIKQQINRSHVHQLQSLLPPAEHTENPLSFCFDLPLLTGQGYERIPIWIEGRRESTAKTSKPTSQWRVVLAFELPDLGKIVADCRLTPANDSGQKNKSAVQMQFFSETNSTNHCIDQHIQQLTHSLSTIGLDVSSHACRSPLPPLGDQRFQHDWVHLQI